jgi:hypothetical protein
LFQILNPSGCDLLCLCADRPQLDSVPAPAKAFLSLLIWSAQSLIRAHCISIHVIAASSRLSLSLRLLSHTGVGWT